MHFSIQRIIKINRKSQTDIFITCLLASEGPFCRAQADKVLNAFTTRAPGISLDNKQQILCCFMFGQLLVTLTTCSRDLTIFSVITLWPNFLLPLQILSISLWVYILFEVVADIHQYLPINEISKVDEKLNI